jgi:hypothetical protein
MHRRVGLAGPQNRSGNRNIFGNNNFNCNNVTIAPQRVPFTKQVGEELLARMAGKKYYS